MNICLYIVYGIVNYAFDHVMIINKVLVNEPKKVSELVQTDEQNLSNYSKLIQY